MAKKKTEAPRMLGLRTCNAKLQGFGGFQWPRKGWVEAPDWTPEPTVNGVCRGGLFFLPWGEGDVERLSPEPDAVWMVVAVDPATVVHIGGKAKAPKAEVMFCGQRDEAVAYLLSNGGAGKAVVYARIMGGDRSTLTGGDRSTLAGGHGSTLTGGHGSTLQFYRWDSAADRRRVVVAYVGEDGIEAGVAYRLDDSGKVIRA